MIENMVHTAKFTAKARVFIVRTETCFCLSVAIADLAENAASAIYDAFNAQYLSKKVSFYLAKAL